MPDWLDRLNTTWLVLATLPIDDGVRAQALSDVEGATIRVHISDDGLHHLLIRCDDPTGFRDDYSDALRCAPVTLDFDGVTEHLIDIACLQPSLFNVFDDLIVSILVENARTGDPVAAAKSTLDRWRELLRGRSPHLTHQQEMAVFAELAVLDVVHGPGGQGIADTWRGPLHEPKDIVTGGGWIEVKAAGISSSTVTIHGLEQLEPVANHQGFLAVLVLAEDPDGLTVGDLVDRLRDRMPADDGDRFDDRLLAAGWQPRPTDRRWQIIEWIVTPDASTPRLLPSAFPADLPAGVTDVRYELSLTVLRSFSSTTPRDHLAQIGVTS